MQFITKLFPKRKWDDSRDIKFGRLEFRNFTARAAIRKAHEFATDQSLQCQSCGKEPLFKKHDLTSSGWTRGSALEREVQQFFEAVKLVHGCAVRLLPQDLLFSLCQ
jgi:hypothetical protein